jgi:PAS domain S-box-containing protein
MPSDRDTLVRDPARLASLRRLALLDTPAEYAFDRLTRLASRILQAPVSLVSLVDADRQFFKSCVGLPEPWASQRETPLSHSFCRHTVDSSEPLIVADAREHPAVHDNPAIGDLGIVAYAGIPLITSDGYALGSFCVIDHVPRVWTDEEVAILQELAAAVMTEIELRSEIIEHKRTAATLNARNREISTLQRISEISMSAQSLGTAFQQIVESISSATGFPIVTIERFDPLRQQMAINAAKGLPAREIPLAVPANATLSGVVARSGQPLVAPNIQPWPDDVSTALYGLNVQTFVGVPIAVGGRVIGTLSLAHPKSIAIDERFPDWVAGMARQVATLIEWRDAEDALREHQEWFCQLTDNIQEVLWIFDLHDTRVIYISPTYEEIWGRTCASLYERPASFLEAVHPDDRDRIVLVDLHQLQASYDTEYRIVRPDGEIRWLSAHITPIANARGEVYRVVGIAKEITEWKHTTEERDRFFMLSLDMLCIAGFDGYFKRLNPAWERTLSFTTTELMAEPFLSFVHPDDREKTRVATEQLNAGQDVILFENRYRSKGGAYKWFEWKATSFPDQQQIYAVARDVTERKQLEAQFMQAQKMESVGRLAGGVAHDFNNLLTAISGYTELVLAELTTNSPIRADMIEIQRTARRAATLTHQLLAFAREQMIEPRVLNLNDLIQDMDRLLRRLLGEDVELVTLPAADLDLVRVDPSQIEQMIVNLAVNARDAMPEGGRLTIETANAQLDAQYTRQYIGVAEGAYVVLSVSDDGIGMDEEVQQHVFEPFYTTKPQGKGTGIGLATCYGIVRQHNGHISIYSEAGHGTTIKVYLPRVAPAAGAQGRHNSAGKLPKGTETVLLAEDEVAVRKLTARVLRGQGYQVLEALNGDDALRVAADHEGAIDLLLTDMVMPQMGGSALAERFRELYPSTRVLFMSGYTDHSALHLGQLHPGVVLLQKPFTPTVLARKVRDILDA